MYYYTLYDLNIQSDTKLNLTLGKFNKANVTIHFTKVTQTVINPVYISQFEQISRDSFLLKIKDVATFYVANPEHIYIEQYTGNMAHIEAYLFGTIFSFILHLKNYIVLHGSAINYNNQAYIISGKSGSGKSTTALYLYNKGYQLISDDVLVIKPINNQYYLLPSYPRIKLCHDVFENLNLDTSNYPLISELRQKYEYPINNITKDKLLINSFIEIVKSDNDAIELNNINNIIAKTNKLLINSFRLHLLKQQGLIQEKFADYTALANNIKIYELKRPQYKDSINDVTQIIEQLIHTGNNNAD